LANYVLAGSIRGDTFDNWFGFTRPVIASADGGDGQPRLFGTDIAFDEAKGELGCNPDSCPADSAEAYQGDEPTDGAGQCDRYDLSEKVYPKWFSHEV
jgi:hypothetical protein